MKTKHTPGPWKVSSLTMGALFIHGVGLNNATVCRVGKNEHAEANAQLIAAAPEMIEALQLALATIERLKPSQPYDSTQGTRDVINAAIAKAEGR